MLRDQDLENKSLLLDEDSVKETVLLVEDLEYKAVQLCEDFRSARLGGLMAMVVASRDYASGCGVDAEESWVATDVPMGVVLHLRW